MDADTPFIDRVADGNRSFEPRAQTPPPSAGEGACGAGGRGAGSELSGSVAPLTRPASRATLSRRGEREEPGAASHEILSLSESRDITERIVAEARAWAGTPYRHQASLKGVGCDCLGLLRGVWRGVLGPEPEVLPPYAASWAESAPGADPLAAAARRHLVPVGTPLPAYLPRAGDVLLFAFRAHLPAKHCAIATGPVAMIHAHDGAAVTEVALTPWWRRHLAHAFRFP